MKMDGTIVPEKLVSELNRQIGLVSSCASIVRDTDAVVGSLNVQVTVTASSTKAELQSPVNPRAARCIADAMRMWSLGEAGNGRAMVLLSIEQHPQGVLSSDDRCQSDSECVLTTFPGCCTCCACGPLRAVKKSADELARAFCSATRCKSCEGVKTDCPACQDPVKEGMRARCIDRWCRLVETRE